MATNGDEWLTVNDAAKLSGYHPESIRELIRQGKIIAPEEVDVPPDERRQPSEIGFVDRPALDLELGQHFLHIGRVPVNDDVEQQAQRTKFFLLPLAAGLGASFSSR